MNKDIQLGNNIRNNAATMRNGGAPNADGIPVFTCLHGTTAEGTHTLVVIENNRYYVNNDTYGSLSSAAEAITGITKNGWAFWKTTSGTTAEEAFGKNNGKKQKEEAQE